MTHDTARATRDLLRGRDRAALATALPAEGGAWPYASLVLVAFDHDLSPILLLSDLAEHSKAIAADSRVSLLFDATEGLDQPLTGARATLLGRAERSPIPRVGQRFLARHPEAQAYAGFGDFHFYRVSVERAHLVAGFGKIHWLTGEALLPPNVHRLDEAEPDIIRHMNEDHGDALELYASKLLGLNAGPWRMTGIDSEGLDLRQAGRVARLGFETPLRSVAEVRKALVDLATRARQR
jgi:putative heme iron utilization protein